MNITRRNLIVRLLGVTALLTFNPRQFLQAKLAGGYTRVAWRLLGPDDRLSPGDVWASHNPNDVECQGEDSYNLIMQAIHPSVYGNAPSLRCDHWRPVGFVYIETIPVVFRDNIGNTRVRNPRKETFIA